MPNSTARTSSVSLGQASTAMPAIRVRRPKANTQPQFRPSRPTMSKGSCVVSVTATSRSSLPEAGVSRGLYRHHACSLNLLNLYARDADSSRWRWHCPRDTLSSDVRGVRKMPIFMVERRFADDLDASAEQADQINRINEEEGVRWLYSFLSADKRNTYCLYEAPFADAIRRAAERGGLA